MSLICSLKSQNLNELLALCPKNSSIGDELQRICFDMLCCRLAARTEIPIVLTSENAEVLAQKTLSCMCFARGE